MSHKYDVFISYTTEDLEQAEYILRVLKNNGLSCWFAPRDIEPGDFTEKIPAAISSCGAFVLVLTHSAQTSKWVHREIKCALDKGKTIFPIAIEKFDLDEKFNFMLSEITRYEAFAHEEATLGKLIRDLNAILDKDESEVTAVPPVSPVRLNKNSTTPSKSPRKKPQKKKIPWLIPAVAGAMLILIVAAVFFFQRSKKEITPGSYVIYNPAYGVVMSSETANNHYLSGQYINQINGSLTSYPANCIWQIDVFSDGTITISQNGKTLGIKNGYNGLGVGGDFSADRWILADIEDGLYYIRNADYQKYVEWFNTKSNWSVYDQVKDENADMFLLQLVKVS